MSASRAVVSALCLALLIVALCSPASAAVTATFALVAPQAGNYTGPCPVNLQFTGTINGPANAAVTYTFSHFVNGSSVISAPITTTIPANGSLPISETLPIDQSQAGFQSNEVDVSSPSPAQGKVYFTVTCVSAPAPSASGGTLPILHNYKPVTAGNVGLASAALKIPAPYDAITTNDPQACAKHLKGVSLFLTPVCGEVLKEGGADIIFTWAGNDKFPDVDGFRAYDADTHQLDSKITSSAGSGVTVLFKRPPLPSGCYVVRAYKGADESPDSNRVCFAASTTQTVTLNPTNLYTWGPFSDDSINYSSEYSTPRVSDGVAIVGFWHQHPLKLNSPSFRRVGLYYNLYPLHAHFIFKATLHLKVSWTQTNPDPYQSTFPDRQSCLYEIARGSYKFWKSLDEPQSSWDDAQQPAPTTDLSLDVTAWVRTWLNNDQYNYGMVMRGRDENRNERSNLRCETQFYTPTLEVTYN